MLYKFYATFVMDDHRASEAVSLQLVR